MPKHAPWGYCHCEECLKTCRCDECQLDNARIYIKELEKMYNATMILQTDGRMTFEKMLEDVPIMKQLRGRIDV